GPAPMPPGVGPPARRIAAARAAGAEASSTWTSRSARRVSSSVAPNASISWWGSLLMKPTVSVSRQGLPDGRLRRWLMGAPFPPAPSSAGRSITRSVRGGGSSVGSSRARPPPSAPGGAVSSVHLAGVGVADQRHRRQRPALALGALGCARAFHMLQPTMQRRDPVARQATIGLDLRLAGSPRANSATQALEVAPQAAHPREVVLELS